MESSASFKKLLAKKKAEGEANPMELKAKGSVLNDLMKELGDMGLDKINSLKKVTVASDSKSGLEHGLAKAADMVEKGPLASESEDGVDQHLDSEDEGEDHEEEMEGEESSNNPLQHELAEHEAHDEENEEELRRQLAEIQSKLARRK